MKFSKIRVSKDEEVELVRAEDRKHGTEERIVKGSNPLKSLVDAVAAFRSYFLTVVPALQDEKANIRITTISLGEKDGVRSLQVSGSLIIEQCGGAVISMTTPRVSESSDAEDDGDDESDVETMHLSKAVMKLIANVETEAARYANGETAQVDAFASTENESRVNDEMAAASAKSTRTPRHKRGDVAGTIPTNPHIQ